MVETRRKRVQRKYGYLAADVDLARNTVHPTSLGVFIPCHSCSILDSGSYVDHPNMSSPQSVNMWNSCTSEKFTWLVSATGSFTAVLSRSVSHPLSSVHRCSSHRHLVAVSELATNVSVTWRCDELWRGEYIKVSKEDYRNVLFLADRFTGNALLRVSWVTPGYRSLD